MQMVLAPIAQEENVQPNHAKRQQKTPGADPPGFLEFWSIYPRKIAKGNARKAYATALGKATVEQIKAGVERYAAERTGEPDKYTKHPATWLNAECWTDETSPAPEGPPDAGRRNSRGDDWMEGVAENLRKLEARQQ